jgi:hypothetical protein
MAHNFRPTRQIVKNSSSLDKGINKVTILGVYFLKYKLLFSLKFYSKCLNFPEVCSDESESLIKSKRATKNSGSFINIIECEHEPMLISNINIVITSCRQKEYYSQKHIHFDNKVKET